MSQNNEIPFLSYAERFQAASEWNLIQEQEKGIVSQITFDEVTYTIVCEPAHKIVYQDPKQDRVQQVQFLVVAQNASENPDDSFIWDYYCDDKLEAAVLISQDIQKRVIAEIFKDLQQ